MKRITLFCGHYGSGKTNIAVSYALKLKEMGLPVSVFDMDIVNPYYRTLDAKEMLDEKGINLVVSGFANSNVDVPALSAESYAMTADKSKYAVVDIGGDDRGALVLGRFAKDIIEENNYEFVFVLNRNRPETSTIEKAKEIFFEIEQTAKINFTAIVSNTHLCEETTKSDVVSGYEFAVQFAKSVNIPLLFTAIEDKLLSSEKFEIKNILPLKLIKYLSFKE